MNGRNIMIRGETIRTQRIDEKFQEQKGHNHSITKGRKTINRSETTKRQRLGEILQEQKRDNQDHNKWSNDSRNGRKITRTHEMGQKLQEKRGQNKNITNGEKILGIKGRQQ